MPEIPLGLSANDRKTTWAPAVRVVNLLAEKSVTNQFNGIDHIQRPGLRNFTTVNNVGPIRSVFRQAGTFNGDFLVVSSGGWFRVTQVGVPTLLGASSGTGRVVVAATSTRALATTIGTVRSTDGVTVSVVVIPDGRSIGSVAQLNGYFILPELNSARFYWIEPGQTNPDGLSFATTESTPGFIEKVERVGDELWFFKQEGMEVWVPTGDADLPFQRVPGRNYDTGCRNGDTVCRFDNSVAWVGNDGLVYRGDATPVRISDHSIEEEIRKSNAADLRAWSFDMDGHRLYCLSLTDKTFAYDVSSQQWSEFSSYGRSIWRAHVGDSGDTFVVAGDPVTNQLYIVDAEVSTDGGTVMERTLTGGIGVVGQPQRCDSLDLYVSTGTATDPNLYPKVRIRWSDDLETFGDWEDVSIGRQGRYGVPVRLNRLGLMRYPGRLFEFTVTDDAVCTFHAASYNEPSR